VDVGSIRRLGVQFGAALALGALLGACGGDDSGNQGGDPSIRIEAPSSAATFATTRTDVRLGGTISRASFARVRNAATGFETDAFVTYNDGLGTWFADVPGLVPGENPITATADAFGDGARTAEARITVIRPEQPVNLILNGPSLGASATYWTDANSVGESHRIALFEDGTGRATTGSVPAESGGAVAEFTWTRAEPDALRVEGCPTCSFQGISRISGSLEEEAFFGQVETVGGAGELAVHVFVLTPGTL